MYKNENSIRFNEWGDTLVWLRRNKDIFSLIEGSSRESLESIEGNNRFRLNLTDFEGYISDHIYNYYDTYNIDDIISLFNKFNYLVNNDEEMSTLLKYGFAVNKDYFNYIKFILGDTFSFVENVITKDINSLYEENPTIKSGLGGIIL